MNSERIKEIQEETAYPESTSVLMALRQVWNECAQEEPRTPLVGSRKELLISFLNWYNEDSEKTPITEDEIDLFIKEKINK